MITGWYDRRRVYMAASARIPLSAPNPLEYEVCTVEEYIFINP